MSATSAERRAEGDAIPPSPHGHGAAGPVGPALPWIDWVRFLAAFEVFLFHLRLYVFKSYDAFDAAHRNVAVIAWFAVTHFGAEAVLIFFALSGYLVGGGLIERVRAGTFKPGAYAIDRATRLFVPFLPALSVAVLLQAVRGEPTDALVVLGNLASLQGVLVPVQPYIGVDWSLAYEFWFYVLGGALALCITRRAGHAAAIATAALALLIFSVLDAHLLFCWLLGALVSQVELRRADHGAILLGLMLSGVGVFFANDLFGAVRSHMHVPPVPIALSRITLTIGVLMVLRNLVALPCHGVRARRIEAVGTRLAAFSYSLYLIHIPLLTILLLLGFRKGQDLTAAALTQYVGSIVLVMLGAYGFYWAFERHTDAIRRWSKRRLPG